MNKNKKSNKNNRITSSMCIQCFGLAVKEDYANNLQIQQQQQQEPQGQQQNQSPIVFSIKSESCNIDIFNSSCKMHKDH